ncbi:Uncharacterized protein LW94_7227 [Fusarium fujikuroi]|nr:Uncharacterized protein LW94_7227 [Fusarium fujikuroi]
MADTRTSSSIETVSPATPTVKEQAGKIVKKLDKALELQDEVKVAAKDKEAYEEASKEHLEHLVSARKHMQRIFFHEYLQGQRLVPPLQAFENVARSLISAYERDGVMLLTLDNIINDIREAGRAVMQELPGDFSEASSNQAEEAVMINARFGSEGTTLGLASTTVANRNNARRAVMINAPVNGNLSDLKGLSEALHNGLEAVRVTDKKTEKGKGERKY